jgi:pimeloyl-ACP methyl ester carboxylesterase
VLLAGIGGLHQAAAMAPDSAVGPMPGRLVDVGGYRLHLSCAGAGSPTVVLLNGLGVTSSQWARVHPAIAAETRVCAYDRAGQGWSEDSSNPADGTHAATDLKRLMSAAGESGPFVLAGHSIGGTRPGSSSRSTASTS